MAFSIAPEQAISINSEEENVEAISDQDSNIILDHKNTYHNGIKKEESLQDNITSSKLHENTELTNTSFDFMKLPSLSLFENTQKAESKLENTQKAESTLDKEIGEKYRKKIKSTTKVDIKSCTCIGDSVSKCKAIHSSKNGLKKLKLLQWDPLQSSDWDQAGSPGHLASSRIKKDISILFSDPIPGIFIFPDESNYCIVKCIVVGPFDTPYEGGFFTFVVRFGHSYPLAPPRVRFSTTDRGKVRFNPNLYSNGKVCLSILGTWHGPEWSPVTSLGSLLLSIQSLLTPQPYYNEPGISPKDVTSERSDRYNEFLTHETIRVAVCDHMEGILKDRSEDISELLKMSKTVFLEYYDIYIEKCQSKSHQDGNKIKDMYGSGEVVYNYKRLIERLENIKKNLSMIESEPEVDEPDSPASSLSAVSDQAEALASSPTTDAAFLISEANDLFFSDEEEEEFEEEENFDFDQGAPEENNEEEQ